MPLQLNACCPVRRRAGFTDSGALFRDALALLKTKGAVPEVAWPYKSGEYMNEPPPEVEQAPRYKIKSYSSLRNIDEIKSSLRENGPVISGVTLYGSAMGDEAAKTGRLPLAVASDHVLGGHAFLWWHMTTNGAS